MQLLETAGHLDKGSPHPSRTSVGKERERRAVGGWTYWDM